MSGMTQQDEAAIAPRMPPRATRRWRPTSLRSDAASTVVAGAVSAVPDRDATMSDVSFLAEILIAP